MESEIDLSFQAEIPRELRVVYCARSEKIRTEFSNLVETVARQFGESLDFWLAVAQLRDQHSSRLFHDLVVLDLIQTSPKYFSGVKIILTDNPILIPILSCVLQNSDISIQVLDKKSRHQRFAYQLKKIVYEFKCIARFVAEVTIVRVLVTKPPPVANEKLTLIDTFMLKGFTLQDRYYCGLFEQLSEQEQRLVRFVPQFSDMTLRELYGAIQSVKTISEKVLLKESFCQIEDIWFAFRYVFRVRKIQIKNLKFRDVDISALFQSEIRSPSRLHGALRGALNFTFPRRLKESEFKLRKVICWFENQAIDKGWSIGFRKVFPTTPTLGYQGFVSGPIATKPMSVEVESEVIPKQLAVMGVGLVQDVREFAAKAEVVTAPAFRFDWVHRSSVCPLKVEKDTRLILLVATAGDRELSRRTLQMVLEINDSIANIELWVKAHPRVPFHALTDTIEEDVRLLDKSGDSLLELLSRAHLVITSELTSIGLEVALMGRPAVIISSGWSQKDLMPQAVPKELWRISRTKEDLVRSILSIRGAYLDGTHFLEAAQSARQLVFEKVTRKNASEFIR